MRGGAEEEVREVTWTDAFSLVPMVVAILLGIVAGRFLVGMGPDESEGAASFVDVDIGLVQCTYCEETFASSGVKQCPRCGSSGEGAWTSAKVRMEGTKVWK